jgi:hypothetical protein
VRRKSVVAVIVFACVFVMDSMDVYVDGVNGLMQAVSYIAFEQVTVAAVSIGFTSTKVEPDGSGAGRQADTAVCRLETAEIRYTIDGTTPTSSVGTLLEIGDVLTITGHDSIMRFRAIRTGAVSGVANCTYSQK